MSREDLDKWEANYRASPGAVHARPEPRLVAWADGWTRGRALDVAGGAGRHALWLARQGYDVDLVDVSPEGLALAEAEAHRRSVSLRTHVLDLDDPSGLPDGPFDLVLAAWFLLNAPHLAALRQRLQPRGRFVYVQPTPENLERHPRPGPRYLLDVVPFRQALEETGFRVTHFEQGWDENGHHTALFEAEPAS